MFTRVLALAFCFLFAIMPSEADSYGFGGGSFNLVGPQSVTVNGWTSGTIKGSSVGFPVQLASSSYRTVQITSTKALSTFVPTDTLSFTAAISTNIYPTFDATSWEVTDINNAVISTGTFSGGTNYSFGPLIGYSFTVPAVPKLGWYHIRLKGPVIDAKMGNAYGSTSFCVVSADSNFPNPGTYQSGDGTSSGYHGDNGQSDCNIAHGIYDLGPYRLSFPTFTGSPSSQLAQTQAYANDYLADLNQDAVDGWNSIASDSARPRQSYANFITFDGSATQIANVTAAAQILGSRVVWEGVNEPNFAYTPSAYYTIHQAFYNAVKAGNSSAKVIGPGVVTFNNGGISWIDQFLALNPSLDAISVHPYNCFEGDAFLADYCMAQLHSTMTARGYGSLPIWDTENGDTFGCEFGLAEYRHQIQVAITNYLEHERWGCPSGQNSFFYDTSHGFWSFPSYRITTQIIYTNFSPYFSRDPLGVLPAFRVMSQQLRGKNFTAELSAGNAHDYIRAYQFGTGSSYTTAFFTQGLSSLPVTVSGASSAVDVFGNPVTITGGTFNATDLPIYVSSTSPLTISDIGNGLMTATNVATTATPTVAAGMDTTNLSRINDGNQYSSYEDNTTYDTATGPYTDSNNVMPAQCAITWGSAQSIKRIGLFFSPPNHQQSAPIAFTVDAKIGGVWVQQFNYTNATAVSIPFADSGTGCTYETDYNGEWAFNIVLPSTISATAIRITETQTSNGYPPDANSLNAAFAQSWPQHMVVRDVRAYSN